MGDFEKYFFVSLCEFATIAVRIEVMPVLQCGFAVQVYATSILQVGATLGVLKVQTCKTRNKITIFMQV